MLLAEFQPKNDAEAAGFFVGVMLAGVISGGIPFFTGLAMRQVSLGIIGGVISAGAGALAGCCGGIPVALIFTMVIVLVAQSGPAAMRRAAERQAEYDDYNDFARPFQLPAPDGERRKGERRKGDRRQSPQAPDRRHEADDDWRRRSEDEERYRQRGFRPRRPDAGPDE